MVDSPASWAAWGEEKATSRPSNSIRPESLAYTPVSTLISVDLPAPFCPIRACTSPRATSKRASRSAGTPRNCLLMPCIESRGAGRSATVAFFPEDGAPNRARAGSTGPNRGSGAAGRSSVGLADVVGRVVLGEQLVGVDDQRRNRLAARVVLHRLEGERPEAGAALHRRVEVTGGDGSEPVLLAVDRDDLDVLAGGLADRLDGRDRAERHLVVVGVDRGGLRVRLQQGLGDLLARGPGEVGILGDDDLHAGTRLDGLVEALLAVDR